MLTGVLASALMLVVGCAQDDAEGQAAAPAGDEVETQAEEPAADAETEAGEATRADEPEAEPQPEPERRPEADPVPEPADQREREPEPEPEPQEEQVPRSRQVAPPAEEPDLPEYDQTANVGFVMGEADLVTDGSRRPIAVGDELTPPATIDVAAASYVEIQFDDQALFRIDENTMASLVSLMDFPRSRETRFQMVSGSIKATVDRVVTGGSYNVQTESMVASVRGTEFQVSAEGDEATLAVQEGIVYYLPTSVDPLALLDTFPGDPPPRLRRIVERLVDEAPRVQSGREVTLRRDDTEGTAQLIDRLEEQIIDIAENPDTATFGQYDALEETVGDLLDAVRPLEEEERSQRRRTREELNEIDTMNIQDVDGQSGRPAGTQVSISTDPPNADIFINGALRGINRLEGLFPVGEALSVRVSAQGYEDFSRRIVPQPATPIRLNVQLRRPVQGLRVNASPSNAEVVINGRSYGRGTVNAEFQDGTEIRVEVSAPGYNPRVRRATVRRGEPLELDIQLQESLADRQRAGAGRLVDRLGVTPAGLVSVDEFGTVGVLGPEGDRIWAVDTANTRMDRGFPVYADQRIYLSGPVEFVVINAAGGNVINREEVPRERAHLFGRRVLLRGNEVVYPTNGSLRVYDRDGALQRELPLPGKALTTPASWGTALVTVLEDGTLIAVDAESGEEQLRVATSATQPVALAPTIRNGVAYFSGNRGTAVAVDLEGERVMWQQPFTTGSVAVTHDLIVTRSAVYAYGQGRLFATRRAGGTQLFEPVNGVAAPPLYHEGILYIPTADERVIMLNAETGEELHQVSIGEGLTTRPVLNGDTAAVGSNRGTVIRLNLLEANLLN